MRLTIRRCAVTLLVLACFYSLARYWLSIRELDQTTAGAAAVAAWERRLEPLQRALPVERGVVGYVAEWDVPGVQYAFGDVEAEYFLSQYVLAPLILKRGATAEWSVAVLDAEAMQIWVRANPDGFEIIEVRHNLYLMRRLGAQ